MGQLSEISVDSELMEIQNLRRLLRKTKLQEQQHSQVYSPISSKELVQSELDTLFSEEPIHSERNEHWKDSGTRTSNTERMLHEARNKLQHARRLLSEMQNFSETSNTLTKRTTAQTEQITDFQDSNQNLPHDEMEVGQSRYNISTKKMSKNSLSIHHSVDRNIERESRKQSITAEPEYDNSVSVKWFQEVSSELINAVHLLKKMYKRTNYNKTMRELESKIDQVWTYLNEQSLQHHNENSCDWFRAYQDLKEEHDEIVQQLQETYDSFRNLQEEHYQLQNQHQDCYVHSQQNEDKIHYLEEQLDKLQVTFLEMQNQRDQYVDKLRKNREEFLQVENCLDELIQMIHILSQKVLVRNKSRSSITQSDHPPMWKEESNESIQEHSLEFCTKHSNSERCVQSSSFQIRQKYPKDKSPKATKDPKKSREMMVPTTKTRLSRYNENHSDTNVQPSTATQSPEQYVRVQRKHYSNDRARVKHSRNKRQMKDNDNSQFEENIVQLLKDDVLHSRELENLERYLDQTLSTLRNFPTGTK